MTPLSDHAEHPRSSPEPGEQTTASPGRSEDRLRSCPVDRSWPRTVAFFGAALLSGFAALNGGWISILFVTLAIVFLAFAAWGSGTASCPNCGTRLTRLMAFAVERCSQCGRYVEVRRRRAWEIDPDRVDASQRFAIPLGESFRMPDLCAACGLPATRFENASMETRESPSSVSLTEGVFQSSVAVPHCEHHSGGGRLDREQVLRPISSDVLLGTQPPATLITVLRVKSYRFYLEFLRMNPETIAILQKAGGDHLDGSRRPRESLSQEPDR